MVLTVSLHALLSPQKSALNNTASGRYVMHSSGLHALEHIASCQSALRAQACGDDSDGPTCLAVAAPQQYAFLGPTQMPRP